MGTETRKKMIEEARLLTEKIQALRDELVNKFVEIGNDAELEYDSQSEEEEDSDLLELQDDAEHYADVLRDFELNYVDELEEE